jgi:hypothetical protein
MIVERPEERNLAGDQQSIEGKETIASTFCRPLIFSHTRHTRPANFAWLLLLSEIATFRGLAR